MKKETLKKLAYALFFGVLSGIIVTFAVSVFIPQFYTDWAAGLVCSGKIEYLSFKQSYYCFTSPTSFFNLGDMMFWAVFKRFIAPLLVVCCILTMSFIKLAEFLYQRKAAAGF